MTTATFAIDLSPTDPDLAGTDKFTFTKTWSGDMAGTSQGVMLSAGDPSTGSAGYVALETFTGSIDGHNGSVAFQQFGRMAAGAQELRYEIVPGSGEGDLEGMTGTLQLDVAEDGTHTVTLV